MLLRRCLVVLALTATTVVTVGLPALAAPTTFADTAGTPFESAVSSLVEAGFVNGCDDDRFCTDTALTRGQFATILVGMLGLDQATTTGTADASSADPTAAASDDPATEADEPVIDASSLLVSPRFADSMTSVHGLSLEILHAAGLLNGCSEDEVCPNAPLTRGQLATLLVGAFGLPAASGDTTFFIDGGRTHGPSIEAVGAAGISTGCGPVTFCTDEPVLRGHAAVFLARAAGLEPTVGFAPFSERMAEHERLEAERRERERIAAAEQRERERMQALIDRGQRAVDVGLAQLGKPYAWGGAGPHRFDCSGLVWYSWERANGIKLPRSSRDMHRRLAPISRSELIPGDLVFYHSPVSHVAMYIGDGRVVDAPGRGRTVTIRSDGLTRRGVVGYGRPGFNR